LANFGVALRWGTVGEDFFSVFAKKKVIMATWDEEWLELLLIVAEAQYICYSLLLFLCGETERVEHCFVMCQVASSIRKVVEHHFGINLGRKHLINANHKCLFDKPDEQSVNCYHAYAMASVHGHY
jgi:hypothetical protein